MSMHKIIKIFTETKLNGPSIDDCSDVVEVIRKAEELKIVYQMNKDIYFCSFKILYELKEAILMIFTLKLPSSVVGSSASGEALIDAVKKLENILTPLEDLQIYRDVDGLNKNIAVIQIVKLIDADSDVGVRLI